MPSLHQFSQAKTVPNLCVHWHHLVGRAATKSEEGTEKAQLRGHRCYQIQWTREDTLEDTKSVTWCGWVRPSSIIQQHLWLSRSDGQRKRLMRSTSSRKKWRRSWTSPICMLWKGHAALPNHLQTHQGQEGIQSSQCGLSRDKYLNIWIAFFRTGYTERTEDTVCPSKAFAPLSYILAWKLRKCRLNRQTVELLVEIWLKQQAQRVSNEHHNTWL